MYPWLCVSLLVPYSLGNHAQLGGGSVAERLRSTITIYLGNHIYYLMNYDEHVECLNVWFCFICMSNNYASLHVFTSKHFILVICMYNFMGLVSQMVSVW